MGRGRVDWLATHRRDKEGGESTMATAWLKAVSRDKCHQLWEFSTSCSVRMTRSQQWQAWRLPSCPFGQGKRVGGASAGHRSEGAMGGKETQPSVHKKSRLKRKGGQRSQCRLEGRQEIRKLHPTINNS